MLLATCVLSAMTLSGVAIATTSPAKSGIVFGARASINSVPEQLFGNAQDHQSTAGITGSTVYDNSSFGTTLSIGYDHAVSSHMTVGVKTGYGYIWSLSHGKAHTSTKSGDISLDVMHIPLVVTGKYFFDSKFLLGAEAGASLQKLNLTGSGIFNDADGRWKIAPKVSLMGGYQWDMGLSVTASAEYVFGKSTDDFNPTNANDVNQALAYYSFGLNVGYVLPL